MTDVPEAGVPGAIEPNLARRDFLRLAALSAGALGTSALLSAIPAGASGTGAVTNVFVNTSVRNQEMYLRVDYTLVVSTPGSRIAYQVAEWPGGSTAGLPQGSVPLADTAAGAGRQTVTLPWTNAQLWDVGDAHLYTVAATIVDGLGVVLGSAQPRFGFREIWRDPTNLRTMLLNGNPLKLRQAPFLSGPNAMYFYANMGVNAIQFQPTLTAWQTGTSTGPYAAHHGALGGVTEAQLRVAKAILDRADEKGWLVMMPTIATTTYREDAVTGDPWRLNELRKEDFLLNLRQAHQTFDRQNRPSIIAWVPGINQIGNGANPRVSNDPVQIGKSLPPDTVGAGERTPPWVNQAMQWIKGEDPTRLVAYHEAGRVSDMHFGNVYLGHYPLQEREDHLSYWAANGDMPFGSAEFGTPFTAPMFKYRLKHDTASDGIPYFTEFVADYLGDKAYERETDTFVNDIKKAADNPDPSDKGRAIGYPFQVQHGCDHLVTTPGATRADGTPVVPSTAFGDYLSLFIRNTNKSWRAWGANGGWHPWIQDIGFGDPYPGSGDKNAEAGFQDGEPDADHSFAGNRWIEWQYKEFEAPENNPEGRVWTEEDFFHADGTPKRLDTGPAPHANWGNPVYSACFDTLQSLLVFLGGPASEQVQDEFTAKDHMYTSGETAQRSIVVVWDGPGTKSLTATWTLEGPAGPVATGTEGFTMAPGTVEKRGISVPMPTVTQPTDLSLKLTVV